MARWSGIFLASLLLLGCGQREGRYQLAVNREGTSVHRLDTATGELQLFVVGASAPSPGLVARTAYWPVASMRANPEEVRQWLREREEEK